MLHAGIGATHVNALLTSINLPAVNESTLKTRKREVGPVFERIAKTSCKNPIEKEKSQWLNKRSSTERDTRERYEMAKTRERTQQFYW